MKKAGHRGQKSFAFRIHFWKVLRMIQSPTIGPLSWEMHHGRVVIAVARVFQKASKSKEGAQAYAAFMGVSRTDLVRWIMLCKERVRIARERKYIKDDHWKELLDARGADYDEGHKDRKAGPWFKNATKPS